MERGNSYEKSLGLVGLLGSKPVEKIVDIGDAIKDNPELSATILLFSLAGVSLGLEIISNLRKGKNDSENK